jgi:hypothetical protein
VPGIIETTGIAGQSGGPATRPAGKHPFTVEQVAALVDQRLEPTIMLADGNVAGFA